ncbi:hypothetical protein jhhlp_004138 [Lomentospora prolificans]|uniref:protein acetyllysine N-acetyltransferase n=1 Tax=Lomentospora prolificans TaxID=41688 RepID=A0A2N3NAT6_9PEZI|nr:hypothetical protein jhhlp_004138 [Lomentospora prolificans]
MGRRRRSRRHRKMGQDESHVNSKPPVALEDRSLSAVASFILQGKAKQIVVLTGAGISTSAGIPDFRSPKTGLYANLARLNLPYPEAVFDIQFFRKNPRPFYVLAKELYPGNFHPTLSHAFISLLAKKGILHKLFTQNIDCLERQAGVPPERIVEAHGSFATQRCIECKKPYPGDMMKTHVEEAKVPKCVVPECSGLVKPDIVFFGEALPVDFGRNSDAMLAADLVIVMGTSLTVYPFAALPDMCRPQAPRLLFNLERVGTLGGRPDDVLELGPCDMGVKKLAEQLGWLDELNELWRDIVGDKEVARQRLRHETPTADLEMMDEEIVESLLESVEGLSLKDYSAGKKQDYAKAKAPQNPSDSGSQAEPSSIVLPKAIINHLENHLQGKLTSGPKSKNASSAGKAEYTNPDDNQSAGKKPEKGEPSTENTSVEEVKEEKESKHSNTDVSRPLSSSVPVGAGNTEEKL